MIEVSSLVLFSWIGLQLDLGGFKLHKNIDTRVDNFVVWESLLNGTHLLLGTVEGELHPAPAVVSHLCYRGVILSLIRTQSTRVLIVLETFLVKMVHIFMHIW